MDTRTLALGLVAALVVVAGGVGFAALTGGLDAGGGDSRSVEDLSAEELPRGVTKSDGLADPAALAAAHNESLAGRSYATRLTVNVRTRTDGGTREVDRVQTTRVSGQGRFLTSLSQEGTASFTRAVWGNDTVALERVATGSNTQYGRANLPRTRRNLSGHVFLEQIVAVGDFELANVSERDGRTVLALRADGTAEGGAASMGGVRSVSAYSGTLVVGLDGTVYRMDVEMTFTGQRGLTNTARFRYELSGLGSTGVDRPDWVPEAASRTGARLPAGVTAVPRPA